MDYLKDKRTNCWSVMTTMKVGEYLSSVKDAHESRGGIKGQRDVLKTTTARRIRDRLVGDIRVGAVLPPIVLGVVKSPNFNVDELSEITSINDMKVLHPEIPVSIIDGMQRTAALTEAVSVESSVNESIIRVEIWIAENVSSLVYRMLVLNTGQVPWTLGRQMTVVYQPLLNEIRNNVPEITRILGLDRNERRVSAGEFSGDDLVELYLAFSLRKTNLDAKEQLSEEFSRLDVVENLSDKKFQEQFYHALRILARLDEEFSRFESTTSNRLSKGRNIFDSQPARIGLIVALAQKGLGRPGTELDTEERQKRIVSLVENSDKLIELLKMMDSDGVGEFLKLDVLREILDQRVGQVGRYERSVFHEAFKALIDDRFETSNMEPYWRAN